MKKLQKRNLLKWMAFCATGIKQPGCGLMPSCNNDNTLKVYVRMHTLNNKRLTLHLDGNLDGPMRFVSQWSFCLCELLCETREREKIKHFKQNKILSSLPWTNSASDGSKRSSSDFTVNFVNIGPAGSRPKILPTFPSKCAPANPAIWAPMLCPTMVISLKGIPSWFSLWMKAPTCLPTSFVLSAANVYSCKANLFQSTATTFVFVFSKNPATILFTHVRWALSNHPCMMKATGKEIFNFSLISVSFKLIWTYSWFSLKKFHCFNFCLPWIEEIYCVAPQNVTSSSTGLGSALTASTVFNDASKKWFNRLTYINK